MRKRKRRSAQFKFEVALEAARGTKTLSELSSEYEVHPSQISEWKSQLLKDGDDAGQFHVGAPRTMSVTALALTPTPSRTLTLTLTLTRTPRPRHGGIE